MTEKQDYKDTVFLPKTEFPMKAGLPQKEPGILAKWEADGLYHKLREARAGREKFILHDGPPYANGDMHIGHALNHILKDMVCRTQSLLGKDAPYVPGWDCHGLPIEWKVEEQYRKKKLNKDEVPVKEFRAECRAYAQHWVNVQREQVKRLGILGNWDKPYLTMDFDSEATIVSELLKFAESGQLYRGAKPVMWSPVEKTALAEAEVEYEDITSTQIDVAFEITESPIPELVGAYAVIWTTTPWTIPVNQAIAYGPDVEYVVVTSNGKRCLVAKDLDQAFQVRSDQRAGLAEILGEVPEKERSWEVDGPTSEIGTIKGSDLAGTVARHPMHHLGGFFVKPRPFLPGDFVTTDSGTGLVHMAPDHGEDDFELCKAHGIEPQFAVEGDGKYRADWAWLGGQGSVINPKFNAPDGPICTDLREAGGLLAASADYQHSYPHSWRSKAKVIYRCTPQWFVPMDKPVAPAQAGAAGGLAQPATDKPMAAPAFAGATIVEDGPDKVGHAATSSTLRETAMSEINRVRFVPEKGRNRIGSMVEGRPDWVLSRQRAWGVPITLFVDRKTGQYLNDAGVNARIVEAIKAEGVDAWEAARAQEYLGADYKAEDYEQVFDILDVWFDSGCTHVFTLESGKWPELSWPADLYLEGSDQHRGWFQSSLLQSCGTRGRAPYNAVLTHGFTMDAKGLKMSKSVGNTVDPLKVMETNGADIIRLWALSVDFTEDHRIGDEILKGVADQYRKLRNTFRYLLGALEGFSEEERQEANLPPLERYILSELAYLDRKLRKAVDDFDFNSYVRALTDFCNEDLSAFFFDIRKDCLYCDGVDSHKRRSYRSVLDILFNALVRYAAPVLVFTAEEVWQSRYPGSDSVHLLEWPEIGRWEDDDLGTEWTALRALRAQVLEAIEPMRREKVVGSGLEAEVAVPASAALSLQPEALAELFITAKVRLADGEAVEVSRTDDHKCGRCWRHLPEVAEDGALCGRCDEVLNG
ncbi:isoleucine--tRNA ligase [uncultured Sphingorhabdus sp.]|uniref:isoleucine--tRNA ligase n=1 Tax=uncultured Sphingorhabdus sp. TaxID=1686106 RepID=UPI002632783D|nr:isoleucine--tRNA ligase [uncultured Sphingorhabdus sp.]HMS20191.1 isoleucine--tRNA ligase [Sphingorhabdus sp.]